MSVLTEQETIVILNRAEMRDGHFTISTTDPFAYRRLLKRLKGWDYKVEELSKDSWQFVIPTQAYSPRTFGLKSSRTLAQSEARKGTMPNFLGAKA